MDGNDYAALREKNIAERKSFFDEFFKDVKKIKDEIKEVEKSKNTENLENEPPKKKRRLTISNPIDGKFRIKNVKLEFRKKYNTRSKVQQRKSDAAKYEEEDEDINEFENRKPKLQVLFPWAKPMQRSIDLMKVEFSDEDQDDEVCDDLYDTRKKTFYKINRSPYDPNTIPSVDEITDEMLDNVAEKSSLKQYCKLNGTSCHQCRQKTLDTKTVCRSGECIGVRGQFCGPCLRGRYGESAIEALKDPNWACPLCRGVCNCSICRTKNGLAPTGILAPTVQEEGYSSVMNYLEMKETADT